MNLPATQSNPSGSSDPLVLNRDVNATRRDYAHLGPDQVLITKIFPTIQGEGPYAGMPAIFVRFAGCNLGKKESCPWCDTYFELAAGRAINVDLVLAQAVRLNQAGCNSDLIVLTGGEPLLQPNADLFIKRAIVYGFKVQVETNGYFWLDYFDTIDFSRPWPRPVPHLSIVVSPKVNARQVYPPPIPRLLQASSCLKMLVDSDPASPYHKLPDYVAEYARCYGKPVYLSPINHYYRPLAPGEVPTVWSAIDADRSHLNYQYAAKLAMEHGYQVSMQTHLMLGLE